MRDPRQRVVRTFGGIALRAWALAGFHLRQDLLSLEGVRFSGRAFVRSGARLHRASFIEIGEGALIGAAHLYALDRLVIGRHAMVNDRVFLCTASHDIHDPGYALVTGPIVIGDYAWLATGCTVLPSVTIGRGAVIGASAVVAKDVPEMAIVVGNPGKVVGRRQAVHADGVTRRLASANPGDRLREFLEAGKV